MAGLEKRSEEHPHPACCPEDQGWGAAYGGRGDAPTCPRDVTVARTHLSLAESLPYGWEPRATCSPLSPPRTPVRDDRALRLPWTTVDTTVSKRFLERAKKSTF